MNPLFRQPLRNLGWGLLFILVDINIVYFDIIPDFIGYIMIVLALDKLGGEKVSFKQAKALAIILLLVSLPQMFFKASVDIGQLSTVELGFHLYNQFVFLLHGLMIYFMLRGLYVIARPIATPELKNSIAIRLKVYMTLLAIHLVTYPFILNTDEEVALFIIFISIIIFIMEILIMRIPFRMSNIPPSKGNQIPNETEIIEQP